MSISACRFWLSLFTTRIASAIGADPVSARRGAWSRDCDGAIDRKLFICSGSAWLAETLPATSIPNAGKRCFQREGRVPGGIVGGELELAASRVRPGSVP